MPVQLLTQGDEAALEAFLRERPETTMFLRSNLRRAGIVDRGEAYQAAYVAVLEGERIAAVAAHAWNGVLLVRAAEGSEAALEECARAAVLRTGRLVKGLSGAWEDVVAARRALGLEGARAALDSREVLYALALDALAPPPALASGRVSARRSREEEKALLSRWRADYAAEALGETPGPALEASSRAQVERAHAGGALWVLLEGGAPAAMSAFNAELPDMVQIGGVYTPPALRGRGHGRAIVAGQLLAAREGGAARAILFTSEANAPARRAYEAIGFRAIGSYGLVLFPEGHRATLR